MLPTAERASEPRWSPDGRLLAYARIEGFLATSRADGFGERALTHPIRGAQDSSPAWSPTGRSWCTCAWPRIRPEGSTNRAPDDPRERARFTFPPVRARERSPGPTGRPTPLDRVQRHPRAAVGGRRRRLPSPHVFEGAKLAGRQPRWSPDGRRVAFVDIDSGVVRALDVRTGRVRTVFRPEHETYDVEYFDWLTRTGRPPTRRTRGTAVSVECVDDPTTDWCEQAQLSIVDLANGQSALDLPRPLASTTEGLDWRR